MLSLKLKLGDAERETPPDHSLCFAFPVSKRFMSAAEPYIPATKPYANIAAAREVQCAGGTWQGAAAPTYLKRGENPCVFVASVALHLFLFYLCAHALRSFTRRSLQPRALRPPPQPLSRRAGASDQAWFAAGIALQVGIVIGFFNGLYKVRQNNTKAAPS